MSNSTYRLVAAAALLVVLAACGAPATATPAAPATTTTTTPALTACGTGDRTMWLADPAGGRLSASAVGDGTTAVVFVHEIGHAGRCGFWPYAHWLAGHDHVLAVLVDRCGYGQSTCTAGTNGDAGIRAETQPAIDWATRHGATRVVLVGASGGGGDALQAAGILTPVAALVDISGDSNDTGADDTADAARDRVPSLFAVAPGDPYVSVPTVAALFAKVPAGQKRCEVVTAQPAVHGWDLLTDPDGDASAFGIQVAAWVRGDYSRSATCG